MSTPLSLPVVSARFRRHELHIIRAALGEYINAYAEAELNGATRNCGLIRVLPERYPAAAEFDRELSDDCRFLWRHLYSVLHDDAASHRLSVSYIDCRLLRFLAALVRRSHKHGYIVLQSPPTDKQWAQHLRKLDRLGRKGRTQWLRSAGPTVCREVESRLNCFFKWVSANFGCSCHLHRPSGIVRIRRQIVDCGIKAALVGLRTAGIQAPDGATLRRLVRMFLREVRRGRWALSIADVAKQNHAAETSLARFVREHLRKSGQLVIIEPEEE